MKPSTRSVAALVLVLLVAQPAAAEQRSSLKLSLLTLNIANAADTISTLSALNRCEFCSEGNAAMGALMDKPVLFIAVKTATVAAMSYMLHRAAPRHPKLARGLAYTFGGAFAVIAIRNTRVGR